MKNRAPKFHSKKQRKASRFLNPPGEKKTASSVYTGDSKLVKKVLKAFVKNTRGS